MEKFGGLAAALGVVLAIVAGIVTIPGIDIGLVLLLLGVVGGIAADQDGAIRVYLAVLVLPVIGTALGVVPFAGEQLGAIFGNLAIAVAGIATSLVARRLYDMVMGTVKGLTSGGS